MASTHFRITPTTGGTGETTVSVTPLSRNTGTADKNATIDFENGGATANVSLKHLFKPYISQSSTSFPATGGTINVSVYSEYDIVFRSIPSWITVSSGNTIVQENQRISASFLGNLPGVFTLTAQPNAGNSRSVSGMNLCHYIGDTLMTGYTCSISGTQAAGYISTDVSELTFNWNEVSGRTFTVSSSTNWTSTITDE